MTTTISYDPTGPVRPRRPLRTRDLRRVRRKLASTRRERLVLWLRKRLRLYWCICGTRWDGRESPNRFYVGHIGSGRVRKHYVCDHCAKASAEAIGAGAKEG